MLLKKREHSGTGIAIFLIAMLCFVAVTQTIPVFAASSTGTWSSDAASIATSIRKIGYAFCSVGIAYSGLKMEYGGVQDAEKAKHTIITLLLAVMAMTALPMVISAANKGGGWRPPISGS